ncbi:MAG: hypothetical protein DCF20_00765 [Pseudanabaena sp.]|nr:MAG: hypothetical protein DCF20_00765 [Pseudanabaena sp.]
MHGFSGFQLLDKTAKILSLNLLQSNLSLLSLRIKYMLISEISCKADFLIDWSLEAGIAGGN